MVFGEIIEPTTRALWDWDVLELPDSDGPEMHWEINLAAPEVVNSLLVGETENILQILQKCILAKVKPLYEPTHGFTVYQLANDNYVITYQTNPDFIPGKLTEKIIPWLQKAKDLYLLTSKPITSLQNNEAVYSPCIIKSLASKNFPCKYPKLEIPNLVTGLVASILSLMLLKKKPCVLYTAFMEQMPLDSINTKDIVELLEGIGLGPVAPYILEPRLPANNLYM